MYCVEDALSVLSSKGENIYKFYWNQVAFRNSFYWAPVSSSISEEVTVTIDLRPCYGWKRHWAITAIELTSPKWSRHCCRECSSVPTERCDSRAIMHVIKWLPYLCLLSISWLRLSLLINCWLLYIPNTSDTISQTHLRINCLQLTDIDLKRKLVQGKYITQT